MGRCESHVPTQVNCSHASRCHVSTESKPIEHICAYFVPRTFLADEQSQRARVHNTRQDVRYYPPDIRGFAIFALLLELGFKQVPEVDEPLAQACLDSKVVQMQQRAMRVGPWIQCVQ